MTTVLFVCLGNAIRSQMAEAFFNHHKKNPQHKATSAGITPDYLYETTIQAMKERGISLEGHKSKPLSRELIEEADIIVALTEQAVPHIPQEKLRIQFFEDPYYAGAHTLRPVRDKIEKFVLELLNELA